MAILADAAGQPYYECASQLADMWESNRGPITRFISRMDDSEPWIITTIQDHARTEARIDLARIAIALEREYAATGAYPATLEEVVEEFGGDLPVDPFTGEPFRYRLESYGFVLYSVGSDLVDDGGAQDGPDIAWWGLSRGPGE